MVALCVAKGTEMQRHLELTQEQIWNKPLFPLWLLCGSDLTTDSLNPILKLNNSWTSAASLLGLESSLWLLAAGLAGCPPTFFLALLQDRVPASEGGWGGEFSSLAKFQNPASIGGQITQLLTWGSGVGGYYPETAPYSFPEVPSRAAPLQ